MIGEEGAGERFGKDRQAVDETRGAERSVLPAHIPDEPVAGPTDEPEQGEQQQAGGPGQPARTGEPALTDDAQRVEQDEEEAAIGAYETSIYYV